MERRFFAKGLAALPLVLAPMLAPILAGAAGRSAHAQARWTPDKPLRIVVPFAAGGSTDVTARLVAQALGERLGQSIIVDNRAGAGGNIAAEHVARAEPDGYTLILATSSTHATNAALYRKLPFNPVRDFTPISQIAFVPNLLVVNPGVPVNSVAELVAYAKARPGQLNYGSGGAGTSLHLAAAVFAQRAGIDMVHVPYRGGAPVAADLISGKIQVSFSPLVEVLQQVRAGKLRALGVTTARRSALLPDIPAISEVIPGYEVALWNGIMGPAGLPAPVVARLASEITAIVGSQEMRSRLGEQGSDPVGSTPPEFAAFLAAEQPKWAELVRISGATID
jgi:tripartite-type tricarboxylate transporter receptor subunit TctC